MTSFGRTLRAEREQRGLEVETVADATGFGRDELLALERDDFSALPADDVVREHLRSYAAYLKVDAELMLADYAVERERCLDRLADAVAQVPRPEADVPPAPVPAGLARGPVVPVGLVVAVVVVVAAAVGAWWILPGLGTMRVPDAILSEPTERPSVPAQAEAPRRTVERPAPPAPRTAVPPAEAPMSEPAPARAPEPSSTWTIPASGVGTGVSDHELVGRGVRFAEGTEVSFWTRVEGGARGDRIVHVWSHNGTEVLRVPLAIGGARWRTYSTKALHPGSAGNWVVEARDPDGVVLARHAFTCVP